ncbi:MAG: S8 family serine peptidase [Chitinophagaceae bacterium]
MKFPKALRRICCFTFLLLVFCLPARAYRINNSVVSFTGDLISWKRNLQYTATDTLSVLLHARHLLSDAELDQLPAADIFVKEYVGDSVYTALIPASLSVLPAAFDGIALFRPEFKIDVSLHEQLGSVTPLTLWVSFFSSVTRELAQDWVVKNGAEINKQKWESRNIYEIKIPANKLSGAAQWYGVQWVQPAITIRPLDQDSKMSMGVALVAAPPALGGWGLTGDGVTIGHGDNCSGIYHIDQRDRVINHNYGYKTNHGVLVNGLIGGQGIMDPAGQGIATHSRFVSTYFDDALLLKTAFYNRYNMTLTNNSYRADRTDLCSYSGVYDVLSANLDKLALENPAQLDVFAASNDGATTCNPYPAGYYTISGGYQTSKNILTVGSCTRELVLANSSSRGPLKDGRLKPEVTAPGQNIYVPIPDNTYMYESGTSLSCPQATGILALLTERYRQLKFATPPGALLKAIAINGATDMGQKGPDFWFGFGLLNARRSLAIIDSNHIYSNVISNTASPVKINIHVPFAAAQLKVLLYYHDSAASMSAAAQLVNDLDLTVKDLSGVVHRPLVLNPDPMHVSDIAVEKADHLNNVEQVIIDNPVPGDYEATVSPFAVPMRTQRFYLVYDIVPSEVKLLYPVTGAAAPASSDMYIYWSGTADSSIPVTLSFSPDGGAAWTTIATIVSSVRMYKWAVPAINSGNCKMRVTQGSMVDETGPFAINTQPILSLSADQCPGSVSLQWSAVPNTDTYYLLKKQGAAYAVADSVSGTDTTYTFSGLFVDSEYCFSVVPSLGGLSGYRAKGLLRQPNSGTCLSAAPGDLAIEAIAAPVSGRRYTASALSTATWLRARIRNLDNVPHNYRIRYNINGTGWKVMDGFSIGAGVLAVQDVDTVDMSAVGSYSIVMTVQDKDILDPVRANDTARTSVRLIANDTIRLTDPFLEDFEGFPDLQLTSDQTGADFPGYWDFANSNDTGRFFSRVPVAAFSTGIASASLDVLLNKDSVFNAFTGTFNLGAYDTAADEVRFDFDYVLRGNPVITDSNAVQVRGSDQDRWLTVLRLKAARGLQSSGTLSLRDIFRRNGQDFSASTQIRFVQSDTTVITDDNGAAGLSIDNVRLYQVLKEISLVSIINPDPELCSDVPQTLRVRLRNGTKTPATSVSLGYIVDNNAAVSEMLSGDIPPDDSLDYSFVSVLSGLGKGFHALKVWVHMPGDDHPENDTLTLRFHISSSIDQYPSLQQFEQKDSSWYVDGVNASWIMGTPQSATINNAASGSVAWKTNLRGGYNISEHSYLVSPCLSTAVMVRPMLSFSLAFEMESCDPEPCDYLYMEYSTDQGRSWNLLGRRGEGTNWYNKYGNNWSGSWQRWHAASIELPRAAWLKLRFVFVSDKAKVLQGAAIDDIHIYDRDGSTVSVRDKDYVKSPVSVTSPGVWIPLLSDTLILASVNTTGSNLSSHAAVYRQPVVSDGFRRQYTVPVSWRLQTNPVPAEKSLIRLYLEDSALIPLWTDSSCKDCTRPPDIYRMGITHFDSPGSNDSLLANNKEGVASYMKWALVNWVPYDKGYYAECAAIPDGEFWLNDGGITGNLLLNSDYVYLNAVRYGPYSVQVAWTCPVDPDMQSYLLERSFDGVHFRTVLEQAAGGALNYQTIDEVFLKYGDSVSYRILGTAKNGKSFYTPARVVYWEGAKGILDVYPVPSTDHQLTIRWNAAAGTPLGVQLFDMAGRLAAQQQLVADKWISEQQVSLRSLPAGTYVLDLELNEQHQRRLVVIQ